MASSEPCDGARDRMLLNGRFKPQAISAISAAGEPAPAHAPGRLHPLGATWLACWLLDPVSKVSAEVHAALIADLDLSVAGIGASVSNFLLLNAICCWLTKAPIFFAFLAGNFLLCALRLAAALLAIRTRPGQRIWGTDFYIFVTLLWCLLEGALTGAAVFSSFSAMQVLGSAAALAPQGVLAARNFSAPRFAMAIILCLDLPYVAGATYSPDHWLVVVLLFTPGYLIATFTAVKHFQKLSIENYVARFASQRQARRDPLTGVLNRLGMAEALDRATSAEGCLTLFLMDLDGFKKVNDTFGHAAGDVLLQMVTARLHEVARKQDSLARLGGDEFALIAPGLTAAAGAGMAARIVAAISAPEYRLCEGMTARIGVSVGYACAPEDGCTLQGLSELADAALYAVKQRGKGSWQRASQTSFLPRPK